jgi:hypothetical protein
MHRVAMIVVLSTLGFQPAPAQQPTTGGFFFSYAPKDRAAFESGYRRHLEWHRAAGDTLSWFGWDVLVGAKPTHFVDGVFGVPFGALDVRVNPAGDQADAAINVLAYADPVSREMLALRPDLSSATPLEDSLPARFAEVIWYDVIPGRTDAFETALATLRRQGSRDMQHPFTVYERVAGAEPGFVLLVWRERLGSFDEHERSPRRTLDRILEAGRSTSIVRSSRSEVWRYRQDLTYLGSGREE